MGQEPGLTDSWPRPTLPTREHGPGWGHTAGGGRDPAHLQRRLLSLGNAAGQAEGQQRLQDPGLLRAQPALCTPRENNPVCFNPVSAPRSRERLIYFFSLDPEGSCFSFSQGRGVQTTVRLDLGSVALATPLFSCIHAAGHTGPRGGGCKGRRGGRRGPPERGPSKFLHIPELLLCPLLPTGCPFPIPGADANRQHTQ